MELREHILSLLRADAARVHLSVLETVTSTNDLARRAGEEGAPEFTVIAAQQQTAGKGRQGRSFYSPIGTGLYLSMLLRPHIPADELVTLTPMAAVAAAEAAEFVSGRPVSIKWVNDLLLDGKKICGILAESQFSEGKATADYVVLGIGINLREPQGGFPESLRGIAGALLPSDADRPDAFAECAAALISALLCQYDGLAERRYLVGYRQRLCVLNRPIIVAENGVERRAVALAADDDLRLLVRYEDGTEQWRATGEIRIRV